MGSRIWKHFKCLRSEDWPQERKDSAYFTLNLVALSDCPGAFLRAPVQVTTALVSVNSRWAVPKTLRKSSSQTQVLKAGLEATPLIRDKRKIRPSFSDPGKNVSSLYPSRLYLDHTFPSVQDSQHLAY